ncbi:MAG: hypothetical protein AAB262_03605 [Elusimicrobiota bacterium]
MDSLKAFLQREPSEEAFMREVRGETAAPGGDVFKGQRFLRAVRTALRWVSRGRIG